MGTTLDICLESDLIPTPRKWKQSDRPRGCMQEQMTHRLKKNTNKEKIKSLSSSSQNPVKAGIMMWWLISDRLSGVDEAPFHCLVCSTLRWSNVPKVFNHVFKPQPLIFHSSPQCSWRDDGDVTPPRPGLSAGLEGARLDEIFLQASQEEKEEALASFRDVQVKPWDGIRVSWHRFHLPLMNQETQ